MKILYGTTNPAKLAAMKGYLKDLDIELISLNDMEGEIPEADETGNEPAENAAQKARAYYRAFGIPVFSCDTGLYFENLPELSPKANVRNIGGKRLTDEEMTEYYGGLAQKYGDITARYKNAICFIYDENNIFTDDSDDLSGNRFIITSVPHPRRKKGFPIDCLSKRADGSGYFYDSEGGLAESANRGFKRFFEEAVSAIAERERGSVHIRCARESDYEVLKHADRHIFSEELKNRIASGGVLIAEAGDSFAGWLRYNLFWDEIPFMNMLFVLGEHRGRGIGSALVREWERMMKSRGHEKVMTSTQANESAQHFYRKMGYEDMGGFIPFGEEFEIIMGRKL